jgi:hypothetical protein
MPRAGTGICNSFGLKAVGIDGTIDMTDEHPRQALA